VGIDPGAEWTKTALRRGGRGDEPLKERVRIPPWVTLAGTCGNSESKETFASGLTE
jgi:hypothetical protein